MPVQIGTGLHLSSFAQVSKSWDSLPEEVQEMPLELRSIAGVIELDKNAFVNEQFCGGLLQQADMLKRLDLRPTSNPQCPIQVLRLVNSPWAHCSSL